MYVVASSQGDDLLAVLIDTLRIEGVRDQTKELIGAILAETTPDSLYCANLTREKQNLLWENLFMAWFNANRDWFNTSRHNEYRDKFNANTLNAEGGDEQTAIRTMRLIAAIGDETLRKEIETVAITENSHRIFYAVRTAQECLPEMERRLTQQRVTATLLRPSSATALPETLLRPANETPTHSTETLLRPLQEAP